MGILFFLVLATTTMFKAPANISVLEPHIFKFHYMFLPAKILWRTNEAVNITIYIMMFRQC